MTANPSSHTPGRRAVADGLRRRLRAQIVTLYGGPVDLRLNRNRRVYFSVRVDSGHPPRLSLHELFTEAPDHIIADIVAMMRGRGDSEAEARVSDYVAHHDSRMRGPESRHSLSLRPKGDHHDLERIASDVITRYFDPGLEARITWGRRGASRKRRRRSIQFASYDHSADLIRVHPLLDAPDTPEFYLNYLIYHEILHKTLAEPEPDAGGRRRVHHPEFRRLERRHEFYRQAIAWEQAFFKRLNTPSRTGRKQPGPKKLSRWPSWLTPGKARASHPKPEAPPSGGADPPTATQLSLFEDALGDNTLSNSASQAEKTEERND